MGAKLRVAGWIALGTVAGALATMQLTAIARSSTSQMPLEELQQLASVFSMVKNNYVDPVDEKKLINDAIAGMVNGLDPHSQYLDKKSFTEFKESTTGKFVGVGIEIGMEDGLVKVATPIEGSPAFRAGLKSGDLITKIDDTPVKGLTMDQAVKRMRGEVNTKVVLNIFRKSENRGFPVTITREEIKVQSIASKMLEPGYGWIRIRQFHPAHLRTIDAILQAVERRERAVEVRIIAVHQIDDTPVFAHDAIKEQPRLVVHCRAHLARHLGELSRVEGLALQTPQPQPLRAKTIKQRPGTMIREQTPHLRLEDRRLVEFSAIGQGGQLSIGHGGPQQIRQSGRQLIIIQGNNRVPGFSLHRRRDKEELAPIVGGIGLAAK